MTQQRNERRLEYTWSPYGFVPSPQQVMRDRYYGAWWTSGDGFRLCIPIFELMAIGSRLCGGPWQLDHRLSRRFQPDRGKPSGVVNLQVENFIREFGGEIVHILEALTAAVQRRAQRAGDRPH